MKIASIEAKIEELLKDADASDALKRLARDAYRQGWADCWADTLAIKEAIVEKTEK